MSRLEFMKELARLLDDLPREEKIEILKYYNGYFDDAGQENEASIIAELGSPAKVAAEVKVGMQEDLAEDAEAAAEEKSQDDQTENAYSYTTTSDSQTENADAYGHYGSQAADGYADTPRYRRERNTWKTVAIIAILMLTFPAWIGLLGGLIGLLGGLIGIVVALVVGLFGAVIGLVGAAVGCIIGGITTLVTAPISGMFSLAIGIFLMGLVLLAGLLFGLVFGKLIPMGIGAISNLIRWCGRTIGNIVDSVTGRR